MENLKYTANYCEENIWQLGQHPELVKHRNRVLFISSLSRNSPLHFQKSAQGDAPVWWDYHVVLLSSNDAGHFIYDFDSTLPFPCEAGHFLKSTFPNPPSMKPDDQPLFKVIEAEAYVLAFHSDRSHMKDQDGQWIFAPPVWPLIQSDGTLSIDSLMDFSNSNSALIYSLEEVFKLID